MGPGSAAAFFSARSLISFPGLGVGARCGKARDVAWDYAHGCLVLGWGFSPGPFVLGPGWLTPNHSGALKNNIRKQRLGTVYLSERTLRPNREWGRYRQRPVPTGATHQIGLCAKAITRPALCQQTFLGVFADLVSNF